MHIYIAEQWTGWWLVQVMTCHLFGANAATFSAEFRASVGCGSGFVTQRSHGGSVPLAGGTSGGSSGEVGVAQGLLTHYLLENLNEVFDCSIFKRILFITDWDISSEIALRLMSLDFTDDKSTLVQVMAWCRQATSHYLSQCWPRSMSYYGVIRRQWVNSLVLGRFGSNF